jgi:hypothetical protein
MAKRLPRDRDWCEWCGEDLPANHRAHQRFCNRSCAQSFIRLKYRKLPDRVIAEMYTLGNMSCYQIADRFGVHHTAVILSLKRSGVERREYTRGLAGGPRPNSGRKRKAA